MVEWYGIKLKIMNVLLILFIVCLLGLGVCAWLILGLKKRVDVLYGGAGGDETNIPRELTRRVTKGEVTMEALEPRLKTVEGIADASVHKVGFLRYNPFADTGGENSFVLALLDRNNTGVVMSSLYLREGMRLYAKKVVGGKPQQQVSEEEKRVLDDIMG